MRCAALLLASVTVFAVAEMEARASCGYVTYFAPSDQARVPPNATTYVFPAFATDVVIEVTSDGKPVDAHTTLVDAGREPAIAVEPKTEGLGHYRIDVKRVTGDGSYGLPMCVSHDFLILYTSFKAPAYRIEWARSERAYRDGDRHVAIVKRSEGLVGNALVVGNSAAVKM